MTRDELEDFLEEAISDSLEMDWHPRDGARSILRALKAAGCQIVQGEPVAWKYETPGGFPRGIFGSKLDELPHDNWTEQPLFAGKVQP
jgi:hypothetical protein